MSLLFWAIHFNLVTKQSEKISLNIFFLKHEVSELQHEESIRAKKSEYEKNIQALEFTLETYKIKLEQTYKKIESYENNNNENEKNKQIIQQLHNDLNDTKQEIFLLNQKIVDKKEIENELIVLKTKLIKFEIDVSSENSKFKCQYPGCDGTMQVYQRQIIEY